MGSTSFVDCITAVENFYVEDPSDDEDLPDGGGVVIVGPTVGEEIDPILTDPPPPGGFPQPTYPSIGFPHCPARTFQFPNEGGSPPDVLVASPWVIEEIAGVTTKKIICEPGGTEPVDSITFSWLSDTTNTTLTDYWSNTPDAIPHLDFPAGVGSPPSIVIPELPHSYNDLAFYEEQSSLWNRTRVAGSFDIRYIYQQPDGSYDTNTPDLARIRVSVYTQFNIEVTDAQTEDPTWQIEYPEDAVMDLAVPGTATIHPTTWSISNGTVSPVSLMFVNDNNALHSGLIDLSLGEGLESGVVSVNIPPTASVDWNQITNPESVFLRLNLSVADSNGNFFSLLDPIDFDVIFPDGLFDPGTGGDAGEGGGVGGGDG